jgi:hypothetical protein
MRDKTPTRDFKPKTNPPARHVQGGCYALRVVGPRGFENCCRERGHEGNHRFSSAPVPASEPREEPLSKSVLRRWQAQGVVALPLELRDRVIEAMEHLSVCVSWTPRLDSICDRCKSARAVLAELRALGGDRG